MNGFLWHSSQSPEEKPPNLLATEPLVTYGEGMSPLETAVSSFLEDSTERAIADGIFGANATASMIAGHLEHLCRQHLDQEVVKCGFIEQSVGAVFGLALSNGQRVALKVFQTAADLTHLRAVHRWQEIFRSAGIAAPEVLLPPTKCGENFAAVYTWLDEGDRVDAHDPEVRRLMATELARLVTIGRTKGGFDDIAARTLPTDDLWGRPHSPLFDFASTRSGAEWIDRIAEEALPVLREPWPDEVLGHHDFNAKNLRIADNQISAIYDWDAMRRIPEPDLVAHAALHFPATWYVDVAPRPSLREAIRFISAYESARGAPFDDAASRRMHAAASYGLAYTARCEHAVDRYGQCWEGSFRMLLKEWLAAPRLELHA